MSRHPILRLNLTLLLFVLIPTFLTLTGCINRTATSETTLPDEELYIDAKLGFTILHPLPWTKNKIPVAAPEYRNNQLSWDIPDQPGSSNMLIKILPPETDEQVLTALLSDQDTDRPVPEKTVADPYPHAIGNALSAASRDAGMTMRRFAIFGTQRTYIISFLITDESYDSLLPLIERTVSSLREL